MAGYAEDLVGRTCGETLERMGDFLGFDQRRD